MVCSMKLKKIVLPALLGLLPLTAPALQAAELQRADVEQIVREYMLSHPELLIEMSNALRAQQEAEQGKADQALIQQYHQVLFKQVSDPVGGNLKGTQTIVEFVDYNCGYCKRATPALRELLASDKSVRIVYKEFPILSETSYIAAKAALAQLGTMSMVGHAVGLMKSPGRSVAKPMSRIEAGSLRWGRAVPLSAPGVAAFIRSVSRSRSRAMMPQTV